MPYPRALRQLAGLMLLWAGQAMATVTPLASMPNLLTGIDAPVWKIGNDLLAVREFNFGTMHDLVRIDGATGAVAPLKDINPGSTNDLASPGWTAVYKGKLYFWVTDPAHGLALWRTDGTADGTQFVMDLFTDQGLATDAVPLGMFNLEDRFLYIATRDGPGVSTKLWNIDPEAGTAVLVKGDLYQSPNYFQLVGDKVQFLHDRTLWSTDGSAGSATAVSGQWFYGQYVALGDKTLELWNNALYQMNLADGSLTQLSYPASNATGWQAIARKADGRFLFTSNGAGADQELWISNGLGSGTYQLTNHLPWYSLVALPYKGGVLYNEQTPTGSVELRWNDGTPYHSVTLATLAPTEDYYTVRMVQAGNLAYVLKHSACCVTVWNTDGTVEGTHQVFHSARTPDQSWELMGGSDERLYLNMTDFAAGSTPRLYVYTPGADASGGGGGGGAAAPWLLLPLLALGIRRWRGDRRA